MDEELVVTGGLFELLEDPDHPIRIWAVGSGFRHVGGGIAAAVGEVPVELVVNYPDGSGFSGLLATTPPEGARLRIGWAAETMADTDVVFTGPPNA